LVAVVSVADEDDGDNGRVTLKIAAGNELGHFNLESFSSSFNLLKVSLGVRQIIPDTWGINL
jgi:hypothetical protein